MEEATHEEIWHEVGVAVKHTPIGRGVFAKQGFGEGMVVGVLDGPVVDDADYESDYCIELTDTLSLEVAAPFRFLNHSCEPNCELLHDEEADELCLTARGPIEAGTELSIDYAWPAGSEIPCQCGAETCRGWVVDTDELHLIEANQSRRSA